MPNVNYRYVMRDTPERSWSWISIDVTGQKTVLDVDKYAIMHRVQIRSRDLRILEPSLSYPCIIRGRERAIVLGLEVLLWVPSDENVFPVLEELQRRLPVEKAIRHGRENAEAESPFEFRVLEVALEAICSFLAAKASELETSAYTTLDELTSKISIQNLKRVRKLKRAMTRLISPAKKVRDELEQLLDDEYDMADLYLTRKLVGVSSSISISDEPQPCPMSPTIGSKISKATVGGDVKNDIGELEMLLEAYLMQIENTLNRLTAVHEYIDDTNNYINIQLDNHRNQLIQLELMLSCGNICLSVFSLITGTFSMNIPYSWNENHGYIFKWVASLTGTFSAALFVIILSYARFRRMV